MQIGGKKSIAIGRVVYGLGGKVGARSRWGRGLLGRCRGEKQPAAARVQPRRNWNSRRRLLHLFPICRLFRPGQPFIPPINGPTTRPRASEPTIIYIRAVIELATSRALGGPKTNVRLTRDWTLLNAYSEDSHRKSDAFTWIPLGYLIPLWDSNSKNWITHENSKYSLIKFYDSY